MIQEPAHASLGAWESYYVIVGSSAAALTGLQFVVITLVSEARGRTTGPEIGAFATPTIVHFCAALLVSATLSAPWRGLFGPAIVIAACGLVGLLYSAAVVIRARRQTHYKMVAEDWTWHVALPVVAYLAQVIAAALLSSRTLEALFAIAGSTLLLVYIGIHNAWDATTYITATRLPNRSEQAASPQPASASQPATATDAGR